MTQADEDAEFERGLAAAAKRKKITTLVTLALVLAAGGAAALWWVNRPPPRCKADDLKAFLDNRIIPAAMVGEVCSLPADLTADLQRLGNAPPDYMPLLTMRMALSQAPLLVKVCSGFLAGLAEGGRGLPGERTATLLKHCPAERFSGFASASQVARASASQLVLASVVYAALEGDSDAAKVASAVLSR